MNKKRNYIFLVYEKKTYYKLRKSSKDKKINSQIMTRLCLVFKVKTQYGKKKLTKEHTTQTNGWTDGRTIYEML